MKTIKTKVVKKISMMLLQILLIYIFLTVIYIVYKESNGYTELQADENIWSVLNIIGDTFEKVFF